MYNQGWEQACIREPRNAAVFTLQGTFTLHFQSVNPDETELIVFAPLSEANCLAEKRLEECCVSCKVIVDFPSGWQRCFCSCCSAAGLSVFLIQALKNRGLGSCITKLETSTNGNLWSGHIAIQFFSVKNTTKNPCPVVYCWDSPECYTKEC